jgi:hypothetical protein
VSDAARPERRIALRRERQRRYRRRVNAHETCTTITLGESRLQALICAGLLDENKAHLKEPIAIAAQAALDAWAVEQLTKAGFR